ncbi:hypothetical protein Tco_1277187, partial [Tanacetum coccineum]
VPTGNVNLRLNALRKGNQQLFETVILPFYRYIKVFGCEVYKDLKSRNILLMRDSQQALIPLVGSHSR